MTIVHCSLASLWGDIFFLLDPFLETAFENSPLAANFKGRNLAILDHPVKGSFGNL